MRTRRSLMTVSTTSTWRKLRNYFEIFALSISMIFSLSTTSATTSRSLLQLDSAQFYHGNSCVPLQRSSTKRSRGRGSTSVTTFPCWDRTSCLWIVNRWFCRACWEQWARKMLDYLNVESSFSLKRSRLSVSAYFSRRLCQEFSSSRAVTCTITSAK